MEKLHAMRLRVLAGASLLRLPPRRAGESDLVRAVKDAVADGVCDGGVCEEVVPAVVFELAGDDGRAEVVAIFENLEEVPACILGERADGEVVERLEKGRFRSSFSEDGRLSSRTIEAAELALVVEGIDLAGARGHPRWQPRSTLVSAELR